MSNKCRSKICSLQIDYKVAFEAQNIQIKDFFRFRICSPRKESKLHFALIREKADQKKVCNYANFTLCIYADASVLSLLTLVIFKTKI